MIQRIQHLYFGFVIINLSLLLSGLEIGSYQAKEMPHQFTIYGIFQGKEVVWGFPFYLVIIALVALLLFTISKFKKLSLQLKLIKFTFLFYLLFVVGITALFLFKLMPNVPDSVSFGFGYYLLILGLPFTYLGLRGIMRDKNLLDSLNRLR
jgi:hypothetical protein